MSENGSSQSRQVSSQNARDDGQPSRLDREFVQSVMSNIAPNPVTGQVDLNDIIKYMSKNPSQMDELTERLGGLASDSDDGGLDNYDFTALAHTINVEKKPFWVLQLEHMGLVDSLGKPVDPAQAHNTRGLRSIFMLFCYDDKNSFRIVDECTGLPNSDTVLKAIRRAIAKPIAPLKPCLPWLLFLSIKLEPHIENLRPFLESLPEPFHWRLETREEAQQVHDGVDALNKKYVRKEFEFVSERLDAGNSALTRKDRPSALQAFDEAIDHLVDVLIEQKLSDEDGRAVRLKLVECYAIHATTLLLPQ